MTTYSLNELTNRMQGKSITLGWDGLVFMNRAKVNTLVQQQYVDRFKENSFSKQIFGAPAVTPGGDEVLEMSGVILGPPRVHFGEANLRNSQVTATMDIVSGTVSYVRKPSPQTPGVIRYSYRVSAHQGFTVSMKIDLAQGSGSVSENGEVTFDIGAAYDCRCDLVNNSNSQIMLGDFFKGLFLAQKPEDRVYKLGILNLEDVDMSAPRSFKIRTMATEEGKNKNSKKYGDGAVVLLVRAKGNPKEGLEPADNAIDYLIPNDLDPQGKPLFSAALVLSSSMIFDWYFQYQIQNKIGNNLRFERGAESSDIARTLHAVTGEIEWPAYYRKYDELPGFTHMELSNDGPSAYRFYNAERDQGLRVYAGSDGALTISCTGQQPLKMFRRHWSLGFPDGYRYISLPVDSVVDFIFDPVVDPDSGKIIFNARPRNDSEAVVVIDYSKLEDIDVPADIQQEVKDAYNPAATGVVNFFNDSALKDNFDIPELNFRAFGDLLFPQENALKLTHARLTGDLALFGHVDRKKTTFTLDPLLPVVKAGEKQQFTIRQLGVKTADVAWEVSTVDGARAKGTVTSDGLFEAPDAQLLEGTAARNHVTATYTDPATGEVVTASAMVTVVQVGVVVTPSLAQIEMKDSEAKTVTLKATTLSGGTLRWTLRGNRGSLSSNVGSEVVYTRPDTPPSGMLEAVLIDIEDSLGEKAIATILLLNGIFSLIVKPTLHPGLRAKSRAYLTGPENTPVKWEVLAGPGSVDSATGEFTAPDEISQPYSVVMGTVGGAVSGLSIVHLSDHAQQSKWSAVDVFDFAVESRSKVWANGRQQAKVIVRFRPTYDKDAPEPLEVSEAEYDRIALVSADEKNPLPATGLEGVPPGGKWHYGASNGYKGYPDTVASSQNDPAEDIKNKIYTKEFWVQTHANEDLMVSARIRNDNFQTFYSNPSSDDGEQNRKAIKLQAFDPPAGGTEGQVLFTLSPEPILIGEADDITLTNTRYYFLKLLIRGVQVGIRNIDFIGRGNMVRWESDTLHEDVYSLAACATSKKNENGDQILNFEEVLLRRMGDKQPSNIVDKRFPVPEGQVLISLFRREYWLYDRYTKQDFDEALQAIVTDDYGNRHPVSVGFDGTNRNRLKLLGS